MSVNLKPRMRGCSHLFSSPEYMSELENQQHVESSCEAVSRGTLGSSHRGFRVKLRGKLSIHFRKPLDLHFRKHFKKLEYILHSESM